MPNPRAWAIGSDRDSRISDPSRAHVASFKPSSGTYRCVKCGDHTSSAGLFCDFHLWNLDHPTLHAITTPE